MQSVKTLFREINNLSPKERQKLLRMLKDEQNSDTNGDLVKPEKHFQKTAADEDWNEALRVLAYEPEIDAPDISDEALRRENLFSREDNAV